MSVCLSVMLLAHTIEERPGCRSSGSIHWDAVRASHLSLHPRPLYLPHPPRKLSSCYITMGWLAHANAGHRSKVRWWDSSGIRGARALASSWSAGAGWRRRTAKRPYALVGLSNVQRAFHVNQKKCRSESGGRKAGWRYFCGVPPFLDGCDSFGADCDCVQWRRSRHSPNNAP